MLFMRLYKVIISNLTPLSGLFCGRGQKSDVIKLSTGINVKYGSRAKTLDYRTGRNPLFTLFFQASSGIRMDQNKGFLPVLYSRVFECNTDLNI